ncbi:MAG: hypothetical protein NC453_19580 [Muribaculum sp.]|nr:hypothetical protein [Muribaculum sp.]
MASKTVNKKTSQKVEATRPEEYTPQPGNKAILSLADFTDENLFGELRRRGYNGELRYSKVVTV